ncbi:helix-turn-helix domain-containing protein [Gordonia otitidis]|uniref:helix-turn-helix domain-containing protein n=1 Tax=Gordonia otitidis TaxID=249058 RepID=UPI00235381A1|nr:helix-turn-helix domain-containing protein [Gordonia otitidis]
MPAIPDITPVNPQVARAYVDTDGAVAYTAIPKSTLETWRSTGDGPAFVPLGRAIRYRITDLDAFMAAHVVRGGGAA